MAATRSSVRYAKRAEARMWWLLTGTLALAAPFARVTESGDAVALELASRTYAHPDGSQVSLVGVSHIGLASFYEAVGAQLGDAEQVLYEGVGGGPESDGQAHTGLNGAYLGMAEGLGLVFQLDALDYTAPNWKNSDLSVEEIGAATGQGSAQTEVADLVGGGPELRKMARLAAKAERSPLVRVVARASMIESLPRAEEMLAIALGPEAYQTLVVARNDRVYADLQEVRGHRSAVLYGAAHLRDLEVRLLADGFEVVSEVWTPAIDADPVTAGVSPKVVALVRKRVVKRLDKVQARAAEER